MSKFCMQCGAQIDDNAEVCSSCGAAQTNVAADAAVASVDGSKKFDVKIIAVAAVAIVIVLLLLKALFGGSYKDPIDNMCKAMETGKGKYLYECVPSAVIKEEYDGMKKKEIIKEFDEGAESLKEYFEDEFGDDLKISYKVVDKEKIDKDDLEEIEDDYDVKVSKGYEVEIKMTVKGDDKKDTNKTTINVYKIKGDWCILDNSLF